MIRIQIFISLLGGLLFSSLSGAAIPPTNPKVLMAPAAVIGGAAGSGFSLLNVKKEFNSKGKYERVVIDIGDMRGEPHKGLPAYYHAQLMKDPSRLVIDFSQIAASQISQTQLQSVLKGSRFVRGAKLLKDPSDNSVSMILDLKTSTKIRVMQVKGVKGTSKVVVDLI